MKPKAWLWSQCRAVRLFWWCALWGVGFPLIAAFSAWDALKSCLRNFPDEWCHYASWPWKNKYGDVSLRAVWRGKDA